MLNYFAVSQDNAFHDIVRFKVPSKNPLQVRLEVLKGDMKGVEGNLMIDVNSNPDNFYPDILDEPLFLVADRVEKVFRYYFDEDDFRGALLMDLKNKESHFYWLPLMEKVECLHESTAFGKDGFVKDMVLSKGKVGRHKIFRVGGIMEKVVVVHLEIAESLLRRNCLGVQLKPIRSI